MRFGFDPTEILFQADQTGLLVAERRLLPLKDQVLLLKDQVLLLDVASLLLQKRLLVASCSFQVKEGRSMLLQALFLIEPHSCLLLKSCGQDPRVRFQALKGNSLVVQIGFQALTGDSLVVQIGFQALTGDSLVVQVGF
jgi:hypothetical protein